MTRRGAIGRLVVGLSSVVAAFSVWRGQDTYYGYLDSETALRRGLNPVRARVFLDGIDITSQRVQSADDRAGWIEILARDANGKAYFGVDGFLQRERRHGHVRVVFT